MALAVAGLHAPLTRAQQRQLSGGVPPTAPRLACHLAPAQCHRPRPRQGQLAGPSRIWFCLPAGATSGAITTAGEVGARGAVGADGAIAADSAVAAGAADGASRTDGTIHAASAGGAVAKETKPTARHDGRTRPADIYAERNGRGGWFREPERESHVYLALTAKP